MDFFLIRLLFCFIILFVSCEKKSCEAYFPISLIRGATLYIIDEKEEDPYVRNGKLPSLLVDSIKLNRGEWEEIIDISSQKLSDSDIASDCFKPDFIIVFTGRVERYVSHVAVSLSCNQLKYEDNSGINVLTENQKEAFQHWYESIYLLKN